MFTTLIVFINKKFSMNMRQFKVLLLFIAFSCSVFAQDRLSLFIGRANKYASVELSDYRKRLCIEYNTPNNLLDDYYRQCGRDWGNVGLALEIAKTSGRHMRDVCDYYRRYHRHGWDRILIEIGIRPGSIYYNPFYDRIDTTVIVGTSIIVRTVTTIITNIITNIIKNIRDINTTSIIGGMMTMTIGMTMMTTIDAY